MWGGVGYSIETDLYSVPVFVQPGPGQTGEHRVSMNTKVISAGPSSDGTLPG